MSNFEIVSGEQRKIGIAVIMAVAETVRQAKRCPSGVIYAALLGKVDLAGYERILSILKGAGLIQVKAHELIWSGPHIPDRTPVELGPADVLAIRYRYEKSANGQKEEERQVGA